MKRRKVLSLAGLAMVLGTFGISRGVAYVDDTIAVYAHAAPCGKLHGFAGLLQSANFVPTGDCQVDVKKGGCHDSGACTISNPASGGSTKGNCKPTADAQSCMCVAR